MDEKTAPSAELKAISTQLRAEIAAAGLKIADIVRQAGIPRPTLDRYLNGTRDIPVMALLKISKVVEVSPSKIMERAQERMG
jgi:transcriptional regulator with XRE-family HTH domain